MGIFSFIDKWKEKRSRRAVERERFEKLFQVFLNETKRLVPKAPKYPEAALFRHAWKRAAVLEIYYQARSDVTNAEQYCTFQKMASSRYFPIAPKGAYGKIPLKLEPDAASHLLDKESNRLTPKSPKQSCSRSLACIYSGIDSHHRVYIGQTIEAPEKRWVQHRASSTGPFKKGNEYVQWGILEGGLKLTQLNERESYYIGFYDAFKNGFNDSRGNDLKAYEQGMHDRQ